MISIAMVLGTAFQVGVNAGHAMGSLDVKEWILILGLIGQLIFFTARSGWLARGFKSDMHAELSLYQQECSKLTNQYRDECQDMIRQYRDENRSLIDQERMNVGETFKALRQYISDVEKHGLSEYMKRDSFHGRMNDLQNSVSKSDALVQMQIGKIEARIGTVETKIDNVRDRLPPLHHHALGG